jgi:hypothetical protein
MIGARGLVFATAIAVLAGCERESARPPAADGLETVEVAPAIDAGASLEGDVVEPRRAAPAGGVAGVLPEGFPADVPLPAPSSLVDFGAGPRGGASVTLEVASTPANALAAYESQLRAAGFVEEGADVWVRGERRVAVAVAPFAGVARLTIEPF